MINLTSEREKEREMTGKSRTDVAKQGRLIRNVMNFWPTTKDYKEKKKKIRTYRRQDQKSLIELAGVNWDSSNLATSQFFF